MKKNSLLLVLILLFSLLSGCTGISRDATTRATRNRLKETKRSPRSQTITSVNESSEEIEYMETSIENKPEETFDTSVENIPIETLDKSFIPGEYTIGIEGMDLSNIDESDIYSGLYLAEMYESLMFKDFPIHITKSVYYLIYEGNYWIIDSSQEKPVSGTFLIDDGSGYIMLEEDLGYGANLCPSSDPEYAWEVHKAFRAADEPTCVLKRIENTQTFQTMRPHSVEDDFKGVFVTTYNISGTDIESNPINLYLLSPPWDPTNIKGEYEGFYYKDRRDADKFGNIPEYDLETIQSYSYAENFIEISIRGDSEHYYITFAFDHTLLPYHALPFPFFPTF